LLDGLRLQARIAQDQPGAGLAAMGVTGRIERRDGAHAHAALSRQTHQGNFIALVHGRHPGHHMQAGGRTFDLHRARQVPLQRLQQCRPAAFVAAADGAHMALVAAVLDQRGQHQLVQARRMPVGQPTGFPEHGHQGRRQHQVAHAHLRGQGLGESADMDDATHLVNGLQGVDGTQPVAELAVVVVLQNPGTRGARPGQQLLPAAYGQHAAQRKLVRGRDIGQTRLAPDQRRGIQALFIDGHFLQACALGLEHAARHQVAGLFHQHGLARIDQHARAQVDGLLRALHHHDLIGRTDKPPRPSQIALQRHAQRRLAFGRVVGQGGLALHDGAVVGAPPGQRGKVIKGQGAVQKVDHGRPFIPGASGLGLRQRIHAPSIGRQAGTAILRRSRNAGRAAALLRASCHARPGALCSLQIALGRKLLVGRRDGGARHTQVQRQRAGGRQARAHGQAAVGHLGFQPFVDAAGGGGRAPGAAPVSAAKWDFNWSSKKSQNWIFHCARDGG